MEVRATAKNVRGSPRKVRLILDAVRGKKVDEALNILRYLPSPSARTVAKVVRSAVANAENNYQMSPTDLTIVLIYADEGRMLKRVRPKARGRVGPVLRRYSHITVVVDEEEG